jgi:acyl-CoA hydrolase
VAARLTFVAIDDAGKPTAVPKLVLDSDAVQKAQAEGEARRAQRLSR